MIGDIRKKGYVLPLGMNSMQKFVDAGFKLKEIVIKEQHNCRSTVQIPAHLTTHSAKS